MMNISIQNRSNKSFVNRLQALKGSYPLTLLSLTALDGLEVFQLKVELESDEELSAFAQDAKFGFGEQFVIERTFKEQAEDYKTEHFVDLKSVDASEDKLFDLRKKLEDEKITVRALEFSSNADNTGLIRAYANNSQDQAMIANLLA